MRINHNIAALNTYRQLNSASTAQSKSMEKLSSGLRINKAGDDAAGLAISEKMRGQIRGLDMAAKNSQDGISMVQTAEGALNETHDILQRMRELATQAANDTNTESDRGEIQKEINQLTSEINRIGNTTEFNTQKLLDGGVAKSSAVSVTATTPGVAGAPANGVTNITQNTASIAEVQGEYTFSIDTALAAGDNLTIGGVAITVASGSGDVDVTSATTKEAQVGAIKTALETDGTFDAQYDVVDNLDGTLTITEKAGQASGTALTIDDSAVTNGGAVSKTDDVNSVAEQAGDYTLTVGTAFTDGESITVAGQTYTFKDDGSGDVNSSTATTKEDQAAALESLLTSDVGTRFTVTDNNDGTLTLVEKAGEATGTAPTAGATGAGGATAGVYSFDLAQPLSGNEITIDDEVFTFTDDATQTGAGYVQIGADADATTANLKAAIDANVTLSGKYAAAGGTGSTIQLTQEAGQESATAPVVSTTTAAGNGFSASFQIGANAGQSMTIDVRDMRATSDALKVASEEGTTVTSKSGKTASYTEATEVTNGTNNQGSFKALDVSSHEKASAAIDVINDAIESVSAERSKLGAFQNRLEHTINNLGTSSENLTAAESRVRDVDMAKEMMTQTKNSILSQAAQAMLAQANQQPQGVLQLLR